MKAIILVAGLGMRLRPDTEVIPKCLIEINRKSILVNALQNLENNGIKETVLVVGYKSEQIRRAVGSTFKSMKITYIDNPIYDKSNNMYSLYLARQYLKEEVILLEGDILFEERILKNVLSKTKRESYWVVDKFTEGYDGCMLITDNNSRIIDIQIVRNKLASYKSNFFKSVGMIRISPTLGSNFQQWLAQEVDNDVLTIYYDLVLAKHIKDAIIQVCDIEGLKWSEIDTLQDLTLARKRWQDK